MAGMARDQQIIRAGTRLGPVPLVPEIRLHQASDPISLWQHTEATSGRTGLDPPFWAFAWAAGQALARHLLDHPRLARGRDVIDVASGSGLVAIAAAMAGAAAVSAYDIDPLAADFGRAYLPRDRLTPLASYDVPGLRATEDSDTKRTTIWSLRLS